MLSSIQFLDGKAVITTYTEFTIAIPCSDQPPPPAAPHDLRQKSGGVL
jgi:hypothetical protein